MRTLLIVTAVLGLGLGQLGIPAYADGTPAPSTSPSPVIPAASPPPSASAAPTPSAMASPSASATPSDRSSTPSATPSPSTAATAAASAPPSPAVAAFVATAPDVEVERLVTASSLSALIDSRARLAQAELAALETHLAAVQADHDAAVADLVAFGRLVDHRGSIRDRLLRDGLRVAALGGQAPAELGAEELDAIREQIVLANALAERGQRLAADEAELQATVESVTAKHLELARLGAEAQLFANGETTTAQLAALQALADEAGAASNAIGELTKDATASLTKDATGHATQGAWGWPVAGTVTQSFGPSALVLEPPLVYGGVSFAHFHDAIDIAAPLGTPVVAAAPGRVTFVGHLPDGAMVVVIAHDDGLVSLSAHLDDAFAPPPVRAGDRVSDGQIIGYVGVTGITTGPHLHFSVHDANGPVDPLVVLAAR